MAPRLAELRGYVLARDGYRCRYCRKPGRLDVDHVVPRSKAPDRLLDKNNLVTLCRACHNRKTGPAEYGRLEIDDLGDEQFAFSLTFTPKYPRRS